MIRLEKNAEGTSLIKHIEAMFDEAQATMRSVRVGSIEYLQLVMNQREGARMDLSDYEGLRIENLRLEKDGVAPQVLSVYLVDGRLFCDLSTCPRYNLQWANAMEIFEIAEAVKYVQTTEETKYMLSAQHL